MKKEPRHGEPHSWVMAYLIPILGILAILYSLHNFLVHRGLLLPNPNNHVYTNSPINNTSIDVAVNDTLLTEYLDVMGLARKLTEPEKKQFLQIAKAYQLNPFKREIYATKYGEGQYAQFSIIVGYETYLKRAERTGKLNGWKVEFSNYEDGELSATITIWRKDWERPLEWEVFYSEQVQKKKDGSVNVFWQKKRQQLRKVAISQGMRLAFPDENGGLPYTDAELGVIETTAEVVETHVSQPVHEAKEVKPQPKALTKLEKAELMKATQNWHRMLGEMLADDTRNVNPEAYKIILTALKQIKDLPKSEKRQLFEGIKAEAQSRNLDWDEEKREFYVIEEYQPTDEEMADALSDNG